MTSELHYSVGLKGKSRSDIERQAFFFVLQKPDLSLTLRQLQAC